MRNLSKQKLYSFINVFGLASGIAFSVLVILFISDEIRYDHFHEDKADIYQVYRQPILENTPFTVSQFTPLPLGQAMKDDFPEVEEFARIIPFGSFVIRTDDGELIEEAGFAFADPATLTMFTFPLLYGNAASALENPTSIVISEEVAQKYFNKTDVVGETLSIRVAEEYQSFSISGVLKNIPGNSSIQFTLLLPIQTIFDNYERYASMQDNWFGTRAVTFVKLFDNANPESLSPKLPEFMEKYMGPMFNTMRERGDLGANEIPSYYNLQPLLDIHLNPAIPGAFQATSDPQYSFIFGGIALAVLLIACFNFMILAIGRSAKRVKEVGLRKVIGAHRSQLMTQFWGEAFVITFLAFIAGIVFVDLILPIFNELSDKSLQLGDLFLHPTIIVGLVLLFLFTGLIAGSYPSLVLANFAPIDSLKQRISTKGANSFTKGLIVIQFGLTIFFLTATLIMTNQLKFMQERNLGFTEEQLVVIPTDGLDGERVLDIYQNEYRNTSSIVSISGANISFASGLWRRGYRYNDEVHQAAVFRVAPNYIETMEMNLTAGRDFDVRLSSDSTQSIIVNHTFLDTHGLDNSVIGQSFPIDWGWMVNPTIIGVVEDFNYQSLENEIAPVIIYMNPRDPIRNLMVRLRPEQVRETIADLEETWASITNEIPFEYSFLDDDMNNLYIEQDRWLRIVSYSSYLAILISCLGLFGLAGLIAVQRQKEIGIRKVLGATTSGITLMLTSSFAKLVLFSIFVASPVAWYVMNNWLKEFAYRIEISGWVFVLSGVVALTISVLTVSYQSIKAALHDPVSNLRSE